MGSDRGLMRRWRAPSARVCISAAAFLSLIFQKPHDGKDGVPVACSCRHTEQLVDLAKIADRFHVATVDSEDESVFRRDNSHEPLFLGRKCDWQDSPEASGSRQDTHESNCIGARRFFSKRILRLQADEIATIAEHNLHLEWQPPKQFSTELCSRARAANDECSCGTDINDIVLAEFSCKDTGAKCPMSADVNTSKENDESHTVSPGRH